MSFQDLRINSAVDAKQAIEEQCGFASGTRVLSQGQYKRVETLVAGDVVDTRDNGPCEIRTLYSYLVPIDMIAPHLVRFQPDAMGPGKPKSAVVMCQHQPIILEHIGLKMVFGADQMLARARTMVNSGDITKVHSASQLRLYQIECAEQQIVLINGMPVATYRPSQNYSLEQGRQHPERKCRVPCGDRGSYGKPVRPILKDFEVDAILAK